MQLTEHDIEKLATLARIDLTDEEKRAYAQQITAILDYAKQVQEVDTSSVKTVSHIDYETADFRDDTPESPTKADAIVKQFPKRAGSLNQVKSVLE